MNLYSYLETFTTYNLTGKLINMNYVFYCSSEGYFVKYSNKIVNNLSTLEPYLKNLKFPAIPTIKEYFKITIWI